MVPTVKNSIHILKVKKDAQYIGFKTPPNPPQLKLKYQQMLKTDKTSQNMRIKFREKIPLKTNSKEDFTK